MLGVPEIRMQARSPAGSDKAGPLQLSLQDDTSAPLVPGRVFSFLPPLLPATSHFSLQNHCHPNGGDAAMLSKVLCVGLGDGYTSVFTFCENHLGNSSKLYFDKKSTKKREQSLLPTLTQGFLSAPPNTLRDLSHLRVYD